MTRAALDDYRFALEARMNHARQTGRSHGAQLEDLVLLLDALLAEPEPVIERAAPAAVAQWAWDLAMGNLRDRAGVGAGDPFPGLVSMGAPPVGPSVYDGVSAWPDYVRTHGMTVRLKPDGTCERIGTTWHDAERDPLENWSA